MKQDTNMEHSAEWLRGAYRIASRYAPMDVVMQINVQLSAAEAREAGEKRGQPCTCLSHQFVECRGAERLGKGWVCQRQQDADAAQPSAAEVIRVAKVALKDKREHRNDSSAYEVCYDWCPECLREKALETISAWEASNDR